jgi:hypothetical protein
MARKKHSIEYGATNGCEREQREEEIQTHHDSRMIGEARACYIEYYNKATRLLANGSSIVEIRRMLRKDPLFFPKRQDGKVSILAAANERSELQLVELARIAVEDAIAGRPPNPR